MNYEKVAVKRIDYGFVKWKLSFLYIQREKKVTRGRNKNEMVVKQYNIRLTIDLFEIYWHGSEGM